MQTISPQKLLKLSFIIPIYNEQETIAYLREKLEAWLAAHSKFATEIILVNDGSKDASLSQLRQWAAENRAIKVLSFSRNFGHQNAVTAGLEYANGDAAVIIDADLQDPLEVVDEMIARYEQGYDVAYGQRVQREGETKFKLGTAWFFYRVMNYCMPVDLPVDTGDFRLVSRKAINALNAMPERHRFLRGLFAWAGFKQIAVPYQRQSRKYGETKYPLRKMLSLAWNGITSFSTIPLRCISLAGIASAGVGLLAIIYALLSIIFGNPVAGWTSMICLTAFIGGMILLSLGIIGEYIGKIYEEIKGRPVFIVAEEINFDDNAARPS